ncbi:MAG: Glutamate--tRNA ligase [Alphaproteobacteria bacterium MarineAlpha6_Bin4]|nr:MAG: Glutamate--tRNA ligase [Alphaproteobacteria bacterium MarineAlpha6_Bin4]|tara:strand:- start:12577 stop:13983 length:1407 start_codon:yes stop_codon:yes gene_type:complete
MKTVTRFAPSPTGNLHIGSARTALFNWLFAKNTKGKFLLRIEDTDKVRSTKDSINKILEGLKWLDLKWDDEIIYQSKNQKRHNEVAEDLLKNGLAYKCFCSEEELKNMREEAKILKKPFRYNRMWRDRDLKDAPKNIDPVIRIKSPIDGESNIDDIIQGSIKVSNEEMDDFIIVRSDGTPTYMLSVVVDDHDMNVTHIVRGHDHLTNTFRQNVIYNAMNWNVPKSAHIPLILGPDGSKMSKRHGAIDVEEYKNNGILSDALINYMLRLGWSHGDDEIISLENAIKWFSLEKIGKSPAKFDNDKLISVNSHYIKELDNNKIISFLENYYNKKYKIELDKISINRLNLGLDDIKTRSRDLNQLAEMALFYCSKFPITVSKKADKYIKKVDKNTFKDLLIVLKNIENDFKKQKIEQIIAKFLSEKGLKLSDIIQYIRAMITGLDVSPRIYDIMEVLGFEEIKKRIEYFING